MSDVPPKKSKKEEKGRGRPCNRESRNSQKREAAEAFILSQQSEGWRSVETHYDDGGFSGGNIERPSLKKLIQDVEAGLVNCIVVYKVDRLSRSLLDFAKLMDVLERHNCSFVSVTQQINTQQSMGRLMLNVLLSFAQFEREIIAERTRDKMAAARRKGKWVGGRPFLGYDIAPGGAALEVNEEEAERVRAIFKLYLDRQSMSVVVEELNERDWTMKRWVTRKGTTAGGSRFSKSSLHGILTNKAYIGEVHYNGHVATAEFPGIVSPSLFQQVQKRLALNTHGKSTQSRNKYSALLRGLLRCGHCDAPMVHTNTKKKGRKVYRYYVCNRAMKEGWDKCNGPSLPAVEIEKFVFDEIVKIGQDASLQNEVIEQHEKQRSLELADVAALQKKSKRQLQVISRKINETSTAGDTQQIMALEREQSDITSRLAQTAFKEKELRERALSEDELRAALEKFAPAWDSLALNEKIRLLNLVIERIIYDASSGQIEITFLPSGIKTLEEQS